MPAFSLADSPNDTSNARSPSCADGFTAPPRTRRTAPLSSRIVRFLQDRKVAADGNGRDAEALGKVHHPREPQLPDRLRDARLTDLWNKVLGVTETDVAHSASCRYSAITFVVSSRLRRNTGS